jgi:peptide/nickel transport system permease protein/dipeptide transport system permease protein
VPHAPTLGTDDIGRDLLGRLLYGARCSLGIGFGVVSISALLGASLGLVAGTCGGWVDTVIMRVTDIVMTLPSILLAIVVVALVGPGLFNAMVAVTVVGLPRFVRVMRAVAMQEMSKQYVQAARVCGASRVGIMWSEVLPNCWGPVLVQATLGFGDAILDIAALGFLGLGARPPMPEWGAMLADARPFIQSSPYLVLLPGISIAIAVLGLNLTGDALQALIDPKGRVA